MTRRDLDPYSRLSRHIYETNIILQTTLSFIYILRLFTYHLFVACYNHHQLYRSYTLEPISTSTYPIATCIIYASCSFFHTTRSITLSLRVLYRNFHPAQLRLFLSYHLYFLLHHPFYITMSTQPRQPLAPKENNSASKGKSSASASKGKSSAPKTSPKINSSGKSHQPRSLDKLWAVDTSRALNVSLPTRYDPFYRFQDRPPVYAPYNSDVLEEMARIGATDYSLALSEDSRCWRLNELLKDKEMMEKFMAKPKGWTVRLGPRGMFLLSL